MAGGQERILRGRIRSVQATKKITRAMELIAASRIVKAQQRVYAAVPYSEIITNVVKDLAAGGSGSDSIFMKPREVEKNVCYVAITADRGLCGGYNAGVLRATEGEVKADVVAGKQYAIVPVGRKAENYFKFRGYSLRKGFAGFSDAPKYENAKAIGQYVTEMYISGEVDRVELVYTRFVSAGTQEVVRRPLIPLCLLYTSAAKYNPTSPLIPLERARLEVLNNNAAKAREEIGKALTLKANYLDAVYLLSQIEIAANNIPAATQSVEAAVFLNPNDPSTLFQLGVLRYSAQNFKGAAEALERAIVLTPVYANARYFLALSYAQLNREQDALAQLLEVQKTNADNKDVEQMIKNLRA
ncbi:MAG: hypothetical protein EBV41_03895 [Actinobacteria bacterium]|nr:hypothetical protein [Actinomycetota bacterium]